MDIKPGQPTIGIAAAAGAGDAQPLPGVTVTATLPTPQNSLTVTSQIPIDGHASQYLPITIKARKTKSVEILSPRVKKVDFLCIKIVKSAPKNTLHCKFGKEGREIDEDETDFSETRADFRDSKGHEEKIDNIDETTRQISRNMPIAKIELNNDLVLVGRPLIKLLGDINTITFYNNHDDEVDVTVYLAYEV